MLRLGFVAGVTPTKWLRIWNERRPNDRLEAFPTDPAQQTDAVRQGDADMAFVRLPVDADGLNLIPLYSEIAVVVAPKDSAIAAVDALTLADIADEPRVPDADSLSLDVVMELVAAGTGIVVLPHSLARLHARKDLISRPVTDAPESRIALAWRVGTGGDDIDEFVGIVRGRTANSSRGEAVASGATPVKRAAIAKKAAAERRAAAAKSGTKSGAGKPASKRGGAASAHKKKRR
ncbi:LysR family transcriptional regulator substrate-binding protein [Rathayibacter sp. YIM 133350]|uniref:LysR family transcriptional regulator substrate-binding protein n=1 Tax=Rathayibacter sp. YIM 133350 TaxID=3131992 RepID=UPI00307EB438